MLERCDNGWIVSTADVREVYEDEFPSADEHPDDVMGERRSLVNALASIVEHVGGRGSRYDAERVRIILEPGDKSNHAHAETWDVMQ